MKGKDITVPKGTEITAYMNGDYTVDPTKFTAAPAMPSTQAPAPATPADLAALVITSLPDGADITVDGKFAGTTPSTLRLSAGDHIVLIEKSGFKHGSGPSQLQRAAVST